jgi:type IV fimbrial biogenesis protein FimT
MLKRNRHLPERRVRGFSLIELMTVVTIVAITAVLAGPSFAQQLANFRVRGAAEGIVNGLNLARAEAARRNSSVSLTLSASGGGWSITQVSPSVAIQSRADGETPGLTIASSTASQTVTFLPTGFVETSATRLEQVTVSSSTPGTNSRQINILGGGLIRVCDPTVASGANDPRAC